MADEDSHDAVSTLLENFELPDITHDLHNRRLNLGML